MSDKKISVIIFGNGKSLKKALITNILGKDLSELPNRSVSKIFKIETFENETYKFICTPDLDTQCDYMQYLSIVTPPDMCLVVVEEGLSETDVWQQVEDLNKKTGKPTDEFTVMLPLRSKAENHPFCTLEKLLSDLDKLAEERGLTLISRRFAGDPESQNQKNKGKLTDTTVNLVLLGMSGTGKSSSGNTILRKRVFTSKPSSNQVTTECQVAETQINGTHVRVIDTPDIFDDETEPSVRDRHVRRCRELCESGPCVFVLVMHVSRFTDGERDVLRKLEKAFGDKVSEQTVILFTRGDDLKQADMSLDQFLHSCQPSLKEIVHKCGNRCVLFEKRRSESEQIEKLMKTVMRMIQQQKQ